MNLPLTLNIRILPIQLKLPVFEILFIIAKNWKQPKCPSVGDKL